VISTERSVRALVGRVGMKDVLHRVRELMLDEALARTGGSRKGAARLLAVDRKYVQKLALQRS
jgi:hypothetical protein